MGEFVISYSIGLSYTSSCFDITTTNLGTTKLHLEFSLMYTFITLAVDKIGVSHKTSVMQFVISISIAL